MLHRPIRRSALPLFALASAALVAAFGTAIARAADAQQTIGALLTAVTDKPPASPSDMHKLQNDLQSHWAGKTITVNAGRVIQVVTEGGGVKLVSFPPGETAGNFVVKDALAHATLAADQEAEGKKLSALNGDLYVVTGTVDSVSAQFNGETENGKAVVRLNLVVSDAKIISTTIVPKKKKPATSQPAKAAE